MIQNNFLRGLGIFGLAVAGTASGWIAYSKYGIDHNVTLPPALNSERATFETSAGSVSYYVDTSGEGTPLVLLHSINAAPSAYEMKPLYEHYAGKRPVYAMELPGFGFSQRRDQEYSPQLYADVINQFMNDVVGTPADVIAFSLTSEFTARAAVEQPEHYNTLTFLVPTGMGRTPSQSETAYDFVSNQIWDEALYDLLAIRGSIRFFMNLAFKGDPPETYIDYAYATSHQPGARHAPFYFLSGQLFTPEIRSEYYTKLTMPVLAIYGDDPNVTFEHLPEVLRANELWRAQRFTESRGMPHWDQLDDTIDALERLWSAEPEAN